MKKIFVILFVAFSFYIKAQTVTSTASLYDKNHHLIAKIKTQGNGKKGNDEVRYLDEIYDSNGHYLGKYDYKTGITNDKDGHKVGTGNLLTTLLK